MQIQWEITEEEYPSHSFIQPPNTNRAIVLTVGYLPGLKVDAIPMLHSNEVLCFNPQKLCLAAYDAVELVLKSIYGEIVQLFFVPHVFCFV